jgi:hypothetical protein
MTYKDSFGCSKVADGKASQAALPSHMGTGHEVIEIAQKDRCAFR